MDGVRQGHGNLPRRGSSMSLALATISPTTMSWVSGGGHRRWLRRRNRHEAASLYLIVVAVTTVVAFLSTCAVLMAVTSLPFLASARFGESGLPADVIPVGPTSVRMDLWSHIDYGLVPLNRPEMDLFVSFLNQEHVVLEYGEGNVSNAVSAFVDRAYVISMDPFSCSGRSGLNPSANASGSGRIAEVRCVPVASRGLHATYSEAKNFVNAVDALEVDKFDVVFIDGRARAACALRVLPYLKPSSTVFIHDFFGRLDLYGGVLQYYDEVARVLAYEHRGGQSKPKGIIALKRKDIVTDDLVPLPDSDLDGLYDNVNLSQEAYATREAAFRIVGFTTDNGFHLKEWKDEKKLSMSLLRVLCDMIGLFGFHLSLKFLRSVYSSAFEPLLTNRR